MLILTQVIVQMPFRISHAQAAGSSGVEGFSAKLANRMVQSNKNENTVLSPYAIRMALSMVAVGAKGETLQQLGPARVPESWSLGKENPTKLLLANRLWIQKTFQARKFFLDSVEQVFGVRPWMVDFTQASDFLADRINGWVEERTSGVIKNFISEKELSPSARMLLISAILFKANWQVPFEPKRTHEDEFNVGGSGRRVPFMQLTGKLNYYVGKGFELVQIPVEGDEISMVIILPTQGQDLEALERTLSLGGAGLGIDRAVKADIQLVLPKFEFENRFSLKKTLGEVGITNAFSKENADFLSITRERDLFLEEMFHKTKISVTEKGVWVMSSASGPILDHVRGAAGKIAQVVGSSRGLASVPHRIRVQVDRPFAFLVWHRKWRTSLLAGHVYQP